MTRPKLEGPHRTPDFYWLRLALFVSAVYGLGYVTAWVSCG